jgi:hypothetical protein
LYSLQTFFKDLFMIKEKVLFYNKKLLINFV